MLYYVDKTEVKLIYIILSVTDITRMVNYKIIQINPYFIEDKHQINYTKTIQIILVMNYLCKTFLDNVPR